MGNPLMSLRKALGKEPKKASVTVDAPPRPKTKYTNSAGEETTPVKEIDKMRGKKKEETFSEKNGKKPMSAIEKKRAAEKAILDSL